MGLNEINKSLNGNRRYNNMIREDKMDLQGKKSKMVSKLKIERKTKGDRF